MKKRNTFKTSVNIKFDLGKEEFVNRYLPTPSHAESLLGLLSGFNGKDLKSNIIIGPYGTGKSLIATIVGGLVSKRIDDETFDFLVKKFNKVHEEIYDELLEVRKLETKFLTVVLNGNEGRFRYAVLNSIIRTINENQIDITLPGQNGKIIQIVDLWEEKFQKTFKAFKKILKDNQKDLDLWRLSILNQDKEEIEWFINIYPSLTSGAEFVVEYNDSFIDQIKFVLDELKKQNIGLFIAYDEFGRMLQTMESHMIHETMQDLQDLAELTNNTADNLHLLLITHRNLAQYLGMFNEEFKNEFQRIEKRFRTYYVESDSATFIRITDSYLNAYKDENNYRNNILSGLVDQLRKYPLFPELNQQEVDKLIIEGTYPIHPVSLFLLPYLSSFFGQNERTLFTFLESNETGGLNNHLQKDVGYYLPSHLFQYFFPSIHDLDTNNEDLLPMKVYKNIISKLPQIEENQDKLSILQFITLWELVGAQSKFKLTTEFLQFALNQDQSQITKNLTELSTLKAIRFNRVLGYWELLEGSSFFIDELIEDKKSVVSINKKKKKELLKGLLTKRYFLANEYNDEKSMTRYAEVEFLFSSEILREDFDLENYKRDRQADAVVFYVILDSAQDLNRVEDFILSVDEDYFLFCVVKHPFSMVEEEVNELAILNEILSDTEILKEDKNLKLELELKKEDLLFLIRDFIRKYYSYDLDCKWIYKKEKHDIYSELALEDLLSAIMFESFSLTPEIRNDSFNRRKVNNMQRKAGYMVLDQVLNHYNEPNLAITGQGPDYLIYATVFKNNQFDFNNLDNLVCPEFKSLRRDLVRFIEENPNSTLKQISSILEKEPYGIRKPLIPILVVSLLRDKWDQITFYRNDMYIAGLTGEKLYKMFEEAEDFHYVYYKFEDEFEEFFSLLEEEFSIYENELIKNKPRFIRLNNAMLSWLRSLPRITQTTLKMTNNLIELKDIIRKSEINPQETITALFDKYHKDIVLLIKKKKYLEDFYNQFKDELRSTIYKIAEVHSFEELTAFAEEKEPKVKKKNKFIRNILNIDIKENWLEEFAYSYLGISLDSWTDVTIDMFLSQLRNDYQNASNQNVKTENSIEIHYNGITKSINKVNLSTKSETIYQNIHRMIKNAGRNVPKEEVEFLLYSLLDEFIE